MLAVTSRESTIMRKNARLAAGVATVALAGAGAAAPTASAYDWTGGAYQMTNGTNAQTWQVGGYPVSCSKARWTGDTENGASSDVTEAVPAFGPAAGGSCTMLGQPATVTSAGPWRFRPVGGSAASHTFEIEIPETTIEFIGCKAVLTGGQRFTTGVGGSWSTGTRSGNTLLLNWDLHGAKYNATHCPFTSGANLGYWTSGNITMASTPAGTPIDVVP